MKRHSTTINRGTTQRCFKAWKHTLPSAPDSIDQALEELYEIFQDI